MNDFIQSFWLLPTPTLRPLLPALCLSTHSNTKWLWLVCLPHFWSITSDINNVPLDKTFACLMRLEAERADPESLFTTQLRLAWGRFILINKLQIAGGWCSMSLCLFSHNLGNGNEKANTNSFLVVWCKFTQIHIFGVLKWGCSKLYWNLVWIYGKCIQWWFIIDALTASDKALILATIIFKSVVAWDQHVQI